MLPEKMSWDEIRALYEKAKYCLWGAKHCANWRRDERNGWYYMWNAYHFASVSDEESVDHTTYARILVMMAHEMNRFGCSDYERYHTYLLPAVKEYEKAMACGQKVSDREYNRIQEERDFYGYQLDHEDDSEEKWKEMVSLIENGELMEKEGFQFYDGKPVYFQHTKDEAVLKISYDDLLAVFRFQGVCSIEINTDPVANWITDRVCCYFPKGDNRLTFAAGDYKIICEKIILEELSSNTKK